MKYIPRIYTLGLLVLVAFLLMVAAYAVSESAIQRTAGSEPSGHAELGTVDPGAQYDWHEQAAFLICPLH